MMDSNCSHSEAQMIFRLRTVISRFRAHVTETRNVVSNHRIKPKSLPQSLCTCVCERE